MLLQFETIKSILKLMSKPALVEQAGKMAVENCVIVIVLSLAAVSTQSLCTSYISHIT